MSFETLGLIEPLIRTIREKQFSHPTPIQTLAIGPALEGRDVLGCAQTGTGKTAAFALPILQRLAHVKHDSRKPRRIRALILAPTRELAAQIGESFGIFGSYTTLRHAVIFGGVSQVPQCKALQRGVDVLVATPGRLLDLLGQNRLTLRDIEVLVLDEADRMLDMGFIRDINRIIEQIPPKRQTMLFSATVPAEIVRLAQAVMADPIQLTVAPETPAAENVEHMIYMVERTGKLDLLHRLLGELNVERSIVFTRTKRGADRVAERLERAGVRACAMHSGKSQNARIRTLNAFKTGQLRVLVASDIAARGIDVTGITHVFNFDMPVEPETYVHRIGRTARAGASGFAASFCSAEEKPALRDIERLLDMHLPKTDVARGHGESEHHEERRPAQRQQGQRVARTQRTTTQHTAQQPTGHKRSGEESSAQRQTSAPARRRPRRRRRSSVAARAAVAARG